MLCLLKGGKKEKEEKEKQIHKLETGSFVLLEVAIYSSGMAGDKSGGKGKHRRSAREMRRLELTGMAAGPGARVSQQSRAAPSSGISTVSCSAGIP